MPLIPSSRAELFLQLQHAPCGEGATASRRGIKPTAPFCSPATALLQVPTKPDPEVAQQVYTTDIGDSDQRFNLWRSALFAMPQGVSPRQLAATPEGDAGTWGAVGCGPRLPAHRGCLRHVRALRRAPRPNLGQLNHALGVSHGGETQPAWMGMWAATLRYGLWLKLGNSVTLAFQKPKIRFHSGIYQDTGANM